MVIQVDARLVVPTVPNFINVLVGDVQSTVGVEMLTDEQIKALGREWTKALMTRRDVRRKNKEKVQ
jgi:hypothetical protein